MDLSEVEKLDSPVKTLKLSEAIRIGARLRPQCMGKLFRDGGSCALGAAYEAIFGHPGDETGNSTILADRFKLISSAVRKMPADAIYSIGIQRNDKGMTREQIADWLEAQGY